MEHSSDMHHLEDHHYVWQRRRSAQLIGLWIGEHLPVLVVGEKVAFRTTYCRFAPEFGIFLANLANPEIGPFRVHYYVNTQNLGSIK